MPRMNTIVDFQIKNDSKCDEEFYSNHNHIGDQDENESYRTIDYEVTDNTEIDDDSISNDIYTKPIIVGYAFGPKKMSTMGVVMAEASKTKLSTATAEDGPRKVVLPSYYYNMNNNTSDYQEKSEMNSSLDDRKPMTSPIDSATGLTQYVLSTHECLHMGDIVSTAKNDDEENSSHGEKRNKDASLISNQSFSSSPNRNYQPNGHDANSVLFTMDGYAAGPTEDDHSTNWRSIVRHFRSSCSSVASDGASTATGTCTASVASSSQLTSTTFLTSSTSSYTRKTSYGRVKKQHLMPVRVSFVPLDPDVPIEEQHGGKIDVILHKLTEDILCLSKLARTIPAFKADLRRQRIEDVEEMSLDADHKQAVQRVLRLSTFHENNPECFLVDDPACVQTLMSRSDIADTLQRCLSGITSKSGIAAGSPAYAVVAPACAPGENPTFHESVGMDQAWLEKQVSGLTYPLIVKPLTAAGTKASHSMAVIMDSSALQKVVADKTPCLLQEYSNHDAQLFKIYVLGDHVSVHKRRSLPNLPINKPRRLSYVEFDSQRPYPRLSDFGYAEDEAERTRKVRQQQNKNSKGNSCTQEAGRLSVNVEEIMPIVQALKNAFGLELFGFDVLITCETEGKFESDDALYDTEEIKSNTGGRRMLVIDVNYFPSYKEVTNFPALLAKYLTDRALQSRRQSQKRGLPQNDAPIDT